MNQKTRHSHSSTRNAQEGRASDNLPQLNRSVHWKCQKLTIFDIFGRPTFLSYEDMSRLFSHRLTLTFQAFLAFGLYATDPHGFQGHIAWYWALLIWTCCAYGFVYLYLALARIIWPLLLRHERSLIGPLLSGAIFSFIYLVVVMLVMSITGPDYAFDIGARYPFLLATFLTLDTAFTRFVLPQIMDVTTPNGTQPAPAESTSFHEAREDTPPRFLKVGDRNLRLDTLLSINSEEHYVHIKTTHETLSVRSKLSDLVATLPEAEGVRPHQSWWISRNAYPLIVPGDGKPVLSFCGDKSAPIARSRQKDVQNWLDRYRDWG